MVTVDSFRRANPRLHVLAVGMFVGLGILATGLWWLQVVKRHEYQSSLETQSRRTTRVPATRGNILDRDGEILAETRPSYNLSVYLEEIRPRFKGTYMHLKTNRIAALEAKRLAYEAQVGRELSSEELKTFTPNLWELQREARFLATSNFVAGIAATVGAQVSIELDPEAFHSHYRIQRALPFRIMTGMTEEQLARFSESDQRWPGVDIEVQPVRHYPNGKVAGHVLGHLMRDDDSAEGEEAYFSYRLPDYRGVVGVESGYDSVLRGRAGTKEVLVNNFGYRHEDVVWMPAKRGSDVVLTLDLDIQKAAEAALQKVGSAPRGAIVVMDVKTGDILAMASSPRYDPNMFVDGLSHQEAAWLYDETSRPGINRATQDNYAPGSIFKTMIGLAALEAGVHPAATVSVKPYPGLPQYGVIYIGKRKVRDSAGPGDYDFERALKLSSNAYFISNGLMVGIDQLIELGRQLHLGETTGLRTRQETSGIWPDEDRLALGWSSGDTANICIGQGKMAVTPLQMAVMTSAIANGGNVLWPRMVKAIRPPDDADPELLLETTAPRIRNRLRVNPESLQVLKDAMLADVEDADGTGRAAALSSVRICGKTGTAQITDLNNTVVGTTAWFISFAPYDDPRVATVIMVEGGDSGGGVCAPLARDIYRVIYPESAGRVAVNR